MGFPYTGVVKTVHTNFLLKVFSERAISGKGDQYVLGAALKNPVGQLVALSLVEYERRYPISITRLIAAGNHFERKGWRQSPTGPHEEFIEVLQPSFVEKYNKACEIIDEHYRTRRDSLRLEKGEVRKSSKRVKFGLLRAPLLLELKYLNIIFITPAHLYRAVYIPILVV